MRSVRPPAFKYIQYHRPVSTEEFFDLVNDTAYTLLVAVYRNRLTFLRNYYDDFTWDSLYDCSLSNPQRLLYGKDELLTLMNIFPNPASASVAIHFISSEKNTGSLQIVNLLGKTVYQQDNEDPHTEFSTSVMLDGLPPGNYFAMIQHGTKTYRQTFMKH